MLIKFPNWTFMVKTAGVSTILATNVLIIGSQKPLPHVTGITWVRTTPLTVCYLILWSKLNQTAHQINNARRRSTQKKCLLCLSKFAVLPAFDDTLTAVNVKCKRLFTKLNAYQPKINSIRIKINSCFKRSSQSADRWMKYSLWRAKGLAFHPGPHNEAAEWTTPCNSRCASSTLMFQARVPAGKAEPTVDKVVPVGTLR